MTKQSFTHYSIATYRAMLRFPWIVLAVSGVLLAWSAYYAGSFRFDASAETLVVEGDADLEVYERIAKVFGGEDFLFLTFEPDSKDPFSPAALQTLKDIVSELVDVEGVKQTFSILDAPLLRSPPIPLTELANGFRTVQSEDVDLALARVELTQSPFFRELLITRDGSGSAIKIDLEADQALNNLTEKRAMVRTRLGAESQEYEEINTAYRFARDAYLKDRERVITEIRGIQSHHRVSGTIHLGGVPMIASDMIVFVKNDLWVFGAAVLGIMALVLVLFFRRVRWVVLPMATAGLSVLFTIGLLGFMDKQATVISSNFISLLAITTISLTIHLIVRYQELLQLQSDLTQKAMVLETMSSKFAPCFFTALTTIAAFGSLMASKILPVEDFGWMMCMGILIAFFVTFTFFPAVLLLLPKGKAHSALEKPNHFIRVLGEFTRWRPYFVNLVALLMAILAIFGIQRVSLDNRFVDYFKPDTEIFKGMHFIDQQLGGTVPFDVVLQFPTYEPADELEEDDFFLDADTQPDPFPERYWFTRDKLDRLERMHRFLTSKPQVGKVLSLTTMEDLARGFKNGEKLSGPEIVGLLGELPEDLIGKLITPYASPNTGELRLSGRIVEGGIGFDRNVFRQEIEKFATENLAFQPDEVEVSGMMVLFNSMLNQILASQVNTLSYVLLAVFLMFLILLRSLHYALLGLIPNILAAASVIAAMGYAGIPLDMMTTTIAAISIGIGVDNSIHYLYRFREEYARWGDPRIAISFSHASIGRALYFTSITVVAGFSILYFSNFVPTVMFGIWIAAAMLLALLANLTLLPALLVATHAKRQPKPELRKGSDDASV